MFRCASRQLRCYKRKRAPEYCDEIDELHGCKYWRTLVWCCGSVCKVTGARDGCVETTGSVAPWVWGQSLVCPCVATLRRTLITLNPTLRRDTSQYSDTKETYYGTRDLTLDTWYTQPDTQQRLDTWPSAETHLYWHNTYYGTWQDTYYGTRHETLDTWYSHPNTLQWHCNILQYTWHLIHSTRHSAETHPHIVTQEIWDKTRDKTHIRYGTRETWHSSLSPWRSAETTWQDTRDTYHGIWQDKRHILWNMTRQETLLWDMTSKDMHIKGDIIWKSEAVNSVHSGYGDKS